MNAEVRGTEKKIWRKSDQSVTKRNPTNKIPKKRNNNGMGDCNNWTDSRLDEMKRKEFARLRHMVPAIAAKPKVPKIAVIEEAIRYIDELHETLAQRVKNNGLPTCLRSVKIDAETSNSEDIREAVKNWIGNSLDFVSGAVNIRSDHLLTKDDATSSWSKADSPSTKTKSSKSGRPSRTRMMSPYRAPYKFTKSN